MSVQVNFSHAHIHVDTGALVPLVVNVPGTRILPNGPLKRRGLDRVPLMIWLETIPHYII